MQDEKTAQENMQGQAWQGSREPSDSNSPHDVSALPASRFPQAIEVQGIWPKENAQVVGAFLSGVEAMYHDRLEEAIEKFTLHLKSATDPTGRCSCMRYIGRCRFKLGDEASARQWLDRAIDEAPNLREPYIELAKLEENLKNAQAALSLIQKAISIPVTDHNVLSEHSAHDGTPFDLGAHMLFLLGRLDEALAFQLEAVRLSPQNERFSRNLTFIKKLVDRKNDVPAEWSLEARIAKKLAQAGS